MRKKILKIQNITKNYFFVIKNQMSTLTAGILFHQERTEIYNICNWSWKKLTDLLYNISNYEYFWFCTLL